MATAAEQLEQQRETENIPQIPSSAVRGAEYQRAVWVAEIAHNVTPDHLLHPVAWAHVASKLKPYDKIEVRRSDRMWYAELMVLDVGQAWAKCYLLGIWSMVDAMLSDVEAASAFTEAMSTHIIDHRGSKGWSVVRKADSAVLVENLNSKQAATDWLMNWSRTNVIATPSAAPMPAEVEQRLNLRPGPGSER